MVSHIVGFPSYEKTKTGRTAETESRVVVARGCGKDRRVVSEGLMVTGFLFWADRNVLELVVMAVQPCNAPNHTF